MIKSTSLVSTISLMEMTGIADSIVSSTFRALEVFLSAAVIYLLLRMLVSKGVSIQRLAPAARAKVRSSAVFRFSKCRRAGCYRRRRKQRIKLMQLQLGFVFKSFTLWPHKTVLQNIIEAPVHVQKRNLK